MVATASAMIGSGMTKTSPNRLLKACAMSRAISTCCFWSLPTGTALLS